MVNVFALHTTGVSGVAAGRGGGYGGGYAGVGGYGGHAGYGSYGGYGYGRSVRPYSSAVVCYSAGANGTIETIFNQPFGWYTGGDDVTAVLTGAGGL